MWLELIKVRVTEADAGKKDKDFWEMMQLIGLPPGLAGYAVYTNAAHQNEVMLVLNWESDNPVPGGSDLARSMAERLRSHGMVSRSAWQGKFM
jgi:hypothetical protein